jgi:hypothetical protein
MKPLLETMTKHRVNRARMPRLSRDPEVLSVQIGVLGTVLVHLLLFLIVPYFLKFEHTDNLGSVPPPRQFNIELAQDYLVPQVEEPPAPFKFVEVNPDAPENAPDTTENFGAQNQQKAQEEESEDMSGDRPALEGQTEIESERIVSGQLSPQVPPMPSAPPQPEPPPETEQTEAAKREQNPLSGFEKSPESSEDGYGSNVAQLPDGDYKVSEHVEGLKDAPADPNGTGLNIKINPNKPMLRPVLEKRARPAIFTENKIGTSNIGPIGLDARWSNYGQYLQQLIETVQIQWDRILIQSRVYPTSGTRVVVKFILNQKGEIARILGVEGTAGDLGQQSCVSAITARSPYGDWTADMISVLGESQEMTFTFYYQ